MFKKNWRRAKEAGLKHGAYHFFYWCRTAGEQADWFIRNVPREANALPPVIDVEWNGESSCKRRISPARVREKMQVFMLSSNAARTRNKTRSTNARSYFQRPSRPS